MMEKNIDSESLKKGLKENKRLFTQFEDRIFELQRGIGALVNQTKDYNDNHKYNHIRHKMWIEQQQKEVLE